MCIHAFRAKGVGELVRKDDRQKNFNLIAVI